MAKISWYRTTVFLSIFLVTSSVYASDTKRPCVKGLETVGYTDPYGDIVIKYGNSLNITCTLYDDYIEENHVNSSKLYFTIGSKRIPSEMVQILNSTSIRLHVVKPSMSSSVYTCKIGNMAVCFNNVMVDDKPLPVTDFKCIGYNYENLTCSWTVPKSYAATNYNLSYYLPGRSARHHMYYCPDKGPHQEGNMMYCTWTPLTTPHYRQVHRIFYFDLTITNPLGTTVVSKTFSHFQHVLSGPAEDLNDVDATTDSIQLHWKIPSSMETFPPGLQHRVMYQSEYGDKTWQDGGMLLTKGKEVKDVYFNLTGLKYAHALYDIRVSLRSDAANWDDESMWSKNSSITVRTKSKPPGSPPTTTIGSFEVVSAGNSLKQTDVYVYWQQIDESIKNGEDFKYQVDIFERPSYVRPADLTSAYAKFANLSTAESYTFKIWSQNSAGQSELASTVFVPREKDRVGHPISFTKIAFGNGDYELSWEAPRERVKDEPITNYTIFWCTHDRDRPYQCSGFLNWTIVESNKTMYNITVPEDKINQFAISANSRTSSSGMVWATCTVLHNKAVGRMETVYIKRVDTTFVEIGWKLDCSDRIGSVMGFIVFYCNIISPSNTSCKESEKNMTFQGDSSLDKANITNLKPYQTYMFAVAVQTRHTSQTQKSSYLYATTLEEAPSSPTNVEVAEVTNSSLKITWQKPKKINGALMRYEVICNNLTYHTKGVEEEFVISNLLSFFNYEISVKACTAFCSLASPIVRKRTLGGYPSRIAQPVVFFQNDTYIVIEWNRPEFPAGKNDIYEVNFKAKLQTENKTVGLITVNDTQYVIQDCGADGRYNTFYLTVRAVNIFNGSRYEGPWSDELESYCLSSGSEWLWLLLIPACILLLVVLICLAVKLYHYCEEMCDVEVKLPSGLAPVVSDIGLTHWDPPKVQEEPNNPSADEELLLVKMSSRDLSGDSSGCSSGHESVTSSLESGTHLSSTSDSGTEQPRSSSTDDFRKNSLRLRNVASSRPTVSKGYVSAPSDGATPPAWSPKTAPGSYCVLGVDPTPIDTGVEPRSSSDECRKNSLRLRNVSASRPPTISKGYVSAPTDGATPPSWSPKTAPGSYCVLGVNPTPITTINPNYVPATQSEATKLPYILPDSSSNPYVLTGDISKPVNSGYVQLPVPEEEKGSPAYVMAGNKGTTPD